MITIVIPEWFIYLLAILVLVYILDIFMRLIISCYKILIMKQEREAKDDQG
jgi:hypothetical protein